MSQILESQPEILGRLQDLKSKDEVGGLLSIEWARRTRDRAVVMQMHTLSGLEAWWSTIPDSHDDCVFVRLGVRVGGHRSPEGLLRGQCAELASKTPAAAHVPESIFAVLPSFLHLSHRVSLSVCDV
jgi:hypothetical protein